MGVNTRNRIITDGLVLNLDAGNRQSYTSGNTNWRDLSGNNNNGTLTNGPTFSSENGGSIVLDGVDDYVQSLNVSHSALLSNTIEVAFKVNSYSGTGKFAIAGYDLNALRNFSDSSTGVIYVESNNKIKSSVITTTQTYRGVTSVTNISLQTYYVATLVRDMNNGVLLLYINGVLESQNTFDVSSYALWPPASPIYVGSNNFIIAYHDSNNWGTGPYFNGSISNVKLYNRILTQQEITQNFNATRTRYGI
jgi:hypothetical protein